jgi:hypothetical protein
MGKKKKKKKTAQAPPQPHQAQQEEVAEGQQNEVVEDPTGAALSDVNEENVKQVSSSVPKRQGAFGALLRTAKTGELEAIVNTMSEEKEEAGNSDYFSVSVPIARTDSEQNAEDRGSTTITTPTAAVASPNATNANVVPIEATTQARGSALTLADQVAAISSTSTMSPPEHQAMPAPRKMSQTMVTKVSRFEQSATSLTETEWHEANRLEQERLNQYEHNPILSQQRPSNTFSATWSARLPAGAPVEEDMITAFTEENGVATSIARAASDTETFDVMWTEGSASGDGDSDGDGGGDGEATGESEAANKAELLLSEDIYLRALKMCADMFDELVNAGLGVGRQDLQRHLAALIEHHTLFRKGAQKNVIKAFLNEADAKMRIYSAYVESFEGAVRAIANPTANPNSPMLVMDWAREQRQKVGMDISQLLLLPLKRIRDYLQVLERVHKGLEDLTAEHAECAEAIQRMQEVVTAVESKEGPIIEWTSMLELQHRADRELTLFGSWATRPLMHQGPMLQMHESGAVGRRWVYLLSDHRLIWVVLSAQSETTLEIKGCLDLAGCRLQTATVGGEGPTTITIAVGNVEQVRFYAPDLRGKREWEEAISAAVDGARKHVVQQRLETDSRRRAYERRLRMSEACAPFA